MTTTNNFHPTTKPEVLCWIGRNHDPAYFFAPAQVARLAEVAEVRFILTRGEKISAERVIQETATAVAAITTWDTVVYEDDILARLPGLKFLAQFGGSVRGLFGERAWEQGIRVVTAVDAMGRMIAELTVAMMMSGLYRLPRHYELQRAEARLFLDAGAGFGQRSLCEKVVALVGFGTIARYVARMLAPFGCTLLAYDPHVPEEEFLALNVTPVANLTELAARADILSLHAPHIPATSGMISREIIYSLRPGAVLVNTAWAELVDMQALEERVLAGELVACLDNVDLMYGPAVDAIRPLRDCPDSLITTIIGMHDDCINFMGRQIVDELRAFSAAKRYSMKCGGRRWRAGGSVHPLKEVANQGKHAKARCKTR